MNITLKGLANFMTATPRGQREIIRDFKYPDPEGRAQARYYREAREYIRTFHLRGNPTGYLGARADWLEQQAMLERRDRAKGRLRNNARVLRDYERHFGADLYEVLPSTRLSLGFGRVHITATPDLHVRQRGREKLVKLEFGSGQVRPEVPRIMTQALYEAARQVGLPIASARVIFVDVRRGLAHTGARMGGRMTAEIRAACQTIEAIWDSI